MSLSEGQGICDSCGKRSGDAFFTRFKPAPIREPNGYRVELCPKCALTLLGELIGWRRSRNAANKAAVRCGQ